MPRRPTPNLRETLLREAVALVDERGADGLHLRELATRAGVSRQAPYLHFPDRLGMLTAVGAEGFRRLRGEIEAAVGGSGGAPEDRVRALARAYAGFATAHPNLREVMSGPHVAKSDSAELQEQAALLFALVREQVGRCPRPCDIIAARRRTVVLWAAVQGVVGLGADRQIPASVGAGAPELVDEAVDTLLRGWAADPSRE